jgi:subtilisin family serine protease
MLVQTTGPDGPGVACVLTPGAPQRFIVQFDAPPAARALRLGLGIEATRAPFERFRRELPALRARVEAARPGAGAGLAVLQRLEVSFNGVAVSGPPELVDELRALPYVRAVFLDDSVHATLDQSVPAIGADRLRTTYHIAGEGIVVAILDTGIDYTHHDLGGCFGPGCRVEAGYDFVNQDPDPMDDHGHGTHVAGIVGANGQVVGVAPAVRLHAYKVLSGAGFGYDSWIIAGIDRALDPDQNPNTPDAVDVINLSLGGGGDADSPLSQAVDEAVAAGVVCAVAAGNDGKPFTIGSPAAARRAITVGACTKSGEMAWFTSLGPAAPDWAIKPDVVAPGVDITSTWPGNRYFSISGTSMATPHVAGTAALLRQLHREWTPDQVKGALMNTANPIGTGPYERGAGLIRALEAGSATLGVASGSLSFARVPAGPVARTDVKTLRLTNRSGAERVVHLSAQGPLPSGVTVAVDPAQLLIPAGGEGSATVTLSVDAGVQVPAHATLAYWGGIVAESAPDRCVVPIGFTKAAEIAIDFDRPDALIVLHDRKGNQALDGWHARRLVRPGSYDVIAMVSGERIIVREGIAVSDSSVVTIRQDEAVHPMQFIPVDETGRVVDNATGLELIHHRASGVGVIVILEWQKTVWLSSMSDAYAWEWSWYVVWPPEKTYTWVAARRGVHAPATFQNSPRDLRDVVSQYRLDPDVEHVVPVHYVCNGPVGLPPNGFILGIGMYSDLDPPLVPPLTLHSYSMDCPDREFQFGAWFKMLENHDPAAGQLYLATPFIRAEHGQPAGAYLQGDRDVPFHVLPGDRLRSGFGPPVWFGRFDNAPDSLRLRPARGRTPWIFPLQGGAWRDHWLLLYSLARNGSTIESGQLHEMGNFWGDSVVVRALTPGAHTWTIMNDRYRIDGRPGVSRAVASFDSRRPDPDPPYLTALEITTDGALTDTVGARPANQVRFEVRDDRGVASARLFQRVDPNQPWAEMTVSRDGDQVRARLPDSTGFLSLKIEAADAAGNSLSYTMEPAVHAGSAIPVRDLSGRATLDGSTVRLTWNVPYEFHDTGCTVYRCDDGVSWSSIGTAIAIGPDMLSFEDQDVVAERRYGYRLGLTLQGLDRLTPVTWVTMPANVLALAGALTTPSRDGPVVRFILPDTRPATLQVIDIAGRVVLEREVGSLGPGPHQVDLTGARAWRSGVYWLKLRHPDGVLARKACVLR